MDKVSFLVPAKLIGAPEKKYKASASMVSKLEAQPDLLYMKSLLVSTGSNGNDDVFLPDEMWQARATPILKPVDWEHNTGREATDEELKDNPNRLVVDNQIIGVMYNSYATYENGVIIDEDKTLASDFEIPESFHIVDEAVIYKGLYPKAAAKIEEGANKDELFVSMEVWFKKYDYLVGNKVVARNEETAFLEPRLRANGGDGIFGNDTVKRVLRNLTFGGKGIVRRPANEPSVIQSVTHQPMTAGAANNKAIASNIICELEEKNTGNNLMEDSDTMDKKAKETVVATNGPSFDDYKKVTQELAEVRTEKKSLASELESVKTERDELSTSADNTKSALTKGAAVLEEALPGIAEKLAKADVSELFNVIADQVKANSTEANSKVEEAEKKAAEAEKKLADVEATARASQRLSQIQTELNLVAASDDEEDVVKAKLTQAQKIAEETKNLDDEAFASKLEDLKSLLSVAKSYPFDKDKDKKDKKDDMKKDDKAKSSDSFTDKDIEDVLNSVVASERAPAAGSEDAQVGVDLNKAYAGLVSSLLGSEKTAEAKDN